MQIDGVQVKAEEGTTVLQAAKQAGIKIPTLCYDDRLAPYGACRLCSVEIKKGERSRIVA
ncbi:(2Fe-2S)-binding protein, partial [bacterium]|nr:(2Fe-2S)-binding protein [bacterium]